MERKDVYVIDDGNNSKKKNNKIIQGQMYTVFKFLSFITHTKNIFQKDKEQ